MVQTISHRFNTHVKRLSLSASVVIIITGYHTQENTINEMVQTISHRFNTHVKRLSLSASVVIIITGYHTPPCN